MNYTIQESDCFTVDGGGKIRTAPHDGTKLDGLVVVFGIVAARIKGEGA